MRTCDPLLEVEPVYSDERDVSPLFSEIRELALVKIRTFRAPRLLWPGKAELNVCSGLAIQAPSKAIGIIVSNYYNLHSTTQYLALETGIFKITKFNICVMPYVGKKAEVTYNVQLTKANKNGIKLVQELIALAFN